MGERLIVERLDGETLVYDTERDEAHRLAGSAVTEFDAAPDDISRRAVLRKLGLAGLAAAGTAPLVKSIVAPTPAQAQSCVPTCTTAVTCCAGLTCGLAFNDCGEAFDCGDCPIGFRCVGGSCQV
jgi:hypothetical protein